MAQDLTVHAGAARAAADGQYLTFSLGAAQPSESAPTQAQADRGEYGLPILSVREIISYVRPTALPGSAPDLRGTINLRGSAVPVIDLGQRLGLGVTQVRARTCIVVVEVPGGEGTQCVGFLADAVNEVIDVEAAQLRPVPTLQRAATASGIVSSLAQRGDGGFVALLAARALLAPDEACAPAGSPALALQVDA
ncbi:chemotaxis protein CheW [Thiomonas sp. FB-6]|uniref:chemotaxis protein CheW n=1 Tax=Thiomonas sp. FB-6 TaxID=1158291 RepID=UPI00037B8EF1|nr:chemotaxis protein CheW [Thiomonas sp. FB-6]